jgi:hypothetical protein
MSRFVEIAVQAPLAKRGSGGQHCISIRKNMKIMKNKALPIGHIPNLLSLNSAVFPLGTPRWLW